MSGLVNGLQNRQRRFESARHLSQTELLRRFRLFFYDENINIFDKYVFVCENLYIFAAH